MEAARPEDPRRETKLLLPVADSRTPQKSLGPAIDVHGNLLRHFQEQRIVVDGQLQIPLIVERHRRHLAQRVFAVEHPPVRAREQRVGDVSNALLDRTIRLGRRSRALNPLALQIRRDFAADEPAVSSVPDTNRRSRDHVVGAEEADPLMTLLAPTAAVESSLPDRATYDVERRQLVENRQDLGRHDVAVGRCQIAANLQHQRLHSSRASSHATASRHLTTLTGLLTLARFHLYLAFHWRWCRPSWSASRGNPEGLHYPQTWGKRSCVAEAQRAGTTFASEPSSSAAARFQADPLRKPLRK